MSGKTIEDLKTLREKLVERRYKEAYGVGNESDLVALARLVAAHHALDAIDAVIAEGRDGPPTTRQKGEWSQRELYLSGH